MGAVGGLPTPGRTSFVRSLGSWPQVAFIPEGDVWYHYWVNAGIDADGNPFFLLQAQGDLDADLGASVKNELWVLRNETWGIQVPDDVVGDDW